MPHETEPEWALKTQQELTGLVVHPRVTTRLVMRPPFRFLHDLLLAIMKSTGYGVGRCPAELLEPSKIYVCLGSKLYSAPQTREEKIRFLSLVISMVIRDTREVVDVDPNCIGMVDICLLSCDIVSCWRGTREDCAVPSPLCKRSSCSNIVC